MKFNVLVVAAMVITSVSAGGRKGGRSGSAVKHVPLKNEPEPEPPSPQGPPDDKPAGFRYFPPNERPQICKDILEDIYKTWDYLQKVNNGFENRLPTVYDMMTEKSNEEESVKGKGHKNSRAEKVQGFLQLRPDLIPKMEQIRARSIELEGTYCSIWGKFVSTECSTEGLEHLSPATMLSFDYFLDWNFDFQANLIDLDE
ncbi:hypothetical protein BASA82_000069 [Batrachochytrium salamandrivorans]|uniref:Uncharacterized protein n=1 Tax=Batrachochytrium salamandrivorans TaxID=1357716 RepID=A0ABQ8FPX2_9FUNG|nr:hypothetical protein BASA60_010066 [Batrachochytrium salamandrivorans]KAH6575118.1 hypothetical protein BASA62_002096 [Batrachochytrium salamandrivorans]KAH6587369.1 hypothetical protein BASA61_006317 [Batrachochytrium salamandrivorans]KAH6601416.1 hypothetical protein BASA50_001606 [Batrachochytrium salamandrivorans]KAH9261943.1 hypothetical protein BASA81_000599 [Batrachochytrium salamandrivorans]